MLAAADYKFLIDENLSRKLTNSLADSFPGSEHVSDQNFLRSSDIEIWGFAQEKGYCILTKDWDYKSMSITFGCPPKVVRLNCGNQTTENIQNLIFRKIETIIDFLNDEDLCYLEVE